MTEPRLGEELLGRIARLLGLTLSAYVAIVVAIVAAGGELALRRSLERSADVIESLLVLYADPEDTDATVAPAMLADQLLGMGDPFIITRMADAEDGMRKVYFLSPTMPAKELSGIPAGMTTTDIGSLILDAIAERQAWRYRVQHRQAGPYDIFVATSRVPYLVALALVAGVGFLLLPIVWFVARRSAGLAVARTLAPLEAAAAETRQIGPGDLGRRLACPTGQAEVTALAESVNRMLDRVEQAHRSLEAFTADASHELRTPLTHLRAQAQWALMESRSNDDMRDALAAIVREVEYTTRLAEDMLLIARSENRQLALDIRPFDVTDVMQEVEEIALAMAADKEVAIQRDGPEATVIGDPERTRQILLNLASNAVRHTDQGSITLRVQPADGRIGLAVIDTGVGITPEHHPHLFDRFYRVDRARDRDQGGAGLGLTIARLLAELQDGTITVQSEPGTGSTFTLWLPRGSQNH